jgi:predicted GNAT superfamily acetyltransferase
MIIRPAQRKDIEAITLLNNIEWKWVSAKTPGFFERYFGAIPVFDVAEERGLVCGFMMVMDQSTNYNSPNFNWFKQMFGRFLYVDRVVVDESKKRKGLGTKFYERLIANRGNTPIVAEVSIEPPNPASIAFHKKLGFRSLGTFSANRHTCNMYWLG